MVPYYYFQIDQDSRQKLRQIGNACGGRNMWQAAWRWVRRLVYEWVCAYRRSKPTAAWHGVIIE